MKQRGTMLYRVFSIRLWWYVVLMVCGPLCAESAASAFDYLPQRYAPNTLRTAWGKPGPDYWQQTMKWTIQARLDPLTKNVFAEGVLIYVNRSPHSLSVLYLDNPAAVFRHQSSASLWRQTSADAASSESAMRDALTMAVESGIHDLHIEGEADNPINVSEYDARTRVEFAQAIKPGQTVRLQMRWRFVPVSRLHPGRPRFGFEQMDSEHYSLAVAQWIPQVMSFTDFRGLSLKRFLGQSEFSPELADYEVQLVVPEGFHVLATGEEKNAKTNKIESCDAYPAPTSSYKPSLVATQQSEKKTFKASVARDFAWVASNALLLQKSCLKKNGKSYYVNVLMPEQDALWQRFGSAAVQHAVRGLHDYFGDFPFQTINVANISGISMEYPGLSLVGFRQNARSLNIKEPSYTRTEKYDVIGGIIHEVAHSYFPLTVNIDETTEGFVDEGLTSWLAFNLEQEWGRDFQSFYGEAQILGQTQNNEQLIPPPYNDPDNHAQKLDSHYHRPAAALNFLRESVLGRDRFDRCLSNLYRTWQSKRMTFSDMQRFIEHETGEDLSWFWRTWFINSAPLQLDVMHVNQVVFSAPPTGFAPLTAEGPFIDKPTLTRLRDRNRITVEELWPQFSDIYSNTPQYVPDLKRDTAPVAITQSEEHYFLELKLYNRNRQPLPFTVRLFHASEHYTDWHVPVDIWRKNEQSPTIYLRLRKRNEYSAVMLDPFFALPISNRNTDPVVIKPLADQ